VKREEFFFLHALFLILHLLSYFIDDYVISFFLFFDNSLSYVCLYFQHSSNQDLKRRLRSNG